MQKLQLRQNQSQKLSPQQIQFIKLLQLSNSNIEAEIKKEIEENPALEENEKNENIDTVNTENYNYYQKSNNENSNFNREENISNTESFRENLISQLNYQKLDKGENIIANQIIGTLDNDGYLRRDLESIIDDIAFAENIEFKNMERGKYFRVVADIHIDGKNYTNQMIFNDHGRVYNAKKGNNWCK